MVIIIKNACIILRTEFSGQWPVAIGMNTNEKRNKATQYRTKEKQSKIKKKY
jgi:hypothetical protein